MLNRLSALAAAVTLAIPLNAATKPGRFAVESGDGLELVHVVAKPVTYQGQKALRLDEEKNYNGEALALLTGSDFTDGTIEVDLAGQPAAGQRRRGPWVCRHRVSLGAPRDRVRVLLPAADQRPRRRPAPAESLDAVHLGA